MDHYVTINLQVVEVGGGVRDYKAEVSLSAGVFELIKGLLKGTGSPKGTAYLLLELDPKRTLREQLPPGGAVPNLVLLTRRG